VLALVVRPIVVTPLLLPSRLRGGERAFVVWGGLKGAVPILLASFALQEGVDDANQIYELVFVVVLASVVLQGTSIPFAARQLLGHRADPSLDSKENVPTPKTRRSRRA
jgi:cell volume regulation protein A